MPRKSTYIPHLNELPSDIVENGFCQNAWAKDTRTQSFDLYWSAPQADQFCMVGSIYKSFGIDESKSIESQLGEYIMRDGIRDGFNLTTEAGEFIHECLQHLALFSIRGHYNAEDYIVHLTVWSDDEDRTQEEVTKALRQVEINLNYRVE